jgi:hypothetical protein
MIAHKDEERPFCADRKPGETCEVCGAVFGSLDDFLPAACIDLEARDDRVHATYPRFREAMERAGGSVAEKITRRRLKGV